MSEPVSDVGRNVENIEGIEEPSGDGWGDYPLDSVFVRQETRTVDDILSRIDKGRYILDPEFQRDFIWPLDKQSKLIESCIMRIPLPVFYVAEATDGRIIVVDGLQRITTFHRYVNGAFRLRGISSKEDDAETNPLEGMNFNELALNLQERILDTQLLMYILDSKAPERARLDIFERVNGGVPLTRQQMRNAIYNGKGTEWLRDAAQSELFQNVTGGSLNARTMRDREAINRFCGFMTLGVSEYRGDMDVFLADTLKEMNQMSGESLTQLRQAFDRSLESNENLFGVHAFRKSIGYEGQYVARSVINISLFEVSSVLFAKAENGVDLDAEDGLTAKALFEQLLIDDDFLNSITYSTNSTSAVNRRFGIAGRALGSLLEFSWP